MKKILFAVLVVFALALVSCKNNEAEVVEEQGLEQVAEDTTAVAVDSVAVDTTAVAE